MKQIFLKRKKCLDDKINELHNTSINKDQNVTKNYI